MTELLLGTKKGLFVLEGEPGGEFAVTARAFPGEPVEYAMRDRQSGRLLAATTSPFYGPKIFHTDDPAGEWQQADGVALPEGGDQALEKIWVLKAGEADGVVYAGGDPGVLFESSDGGLTWAINQGLWNQPSRPGWEPGGGGLCLHSIVPWPGEPDRLAVAVSAAGMWLSEDGGSSLAPRQPRPGSRLRAGRGAGGRQHPALRPSRRALPSPARSACSSSSTVASSAQMTGARAGSTSPLGFHPTSAFR